MPRYTFQWEVVPNGIVESVGAALGLRAGDIRAELARRYGARPKEQFVGDTWPTLRDAWLALDARSRAHVVEQLRDHGLGDDSINVRAHGGEDLYLRSVRNTATLRRVVVQEFWLLGSPRAEVGPEEGRSAAAESRADGPGEQDGVAAGGEDDGLWLQAITPPRPWADLGQGIGIGGEDRGPAILDGLQRDLMMDETWTVRRSRSLEWWGGPVPMRVDVSEPAACFGDPTVKVTAVVELLGDVAASGDTVLEWIALRNMKASVGALAWIPGQRRVVAFLTHYAHPASGSIDRLFPGFLLLMYTEALALVGQGGLAEILHATAMPRPHPIAGTRTDYDELIGTTDMEIIPRGSEANAWIGAELAALPDAMGALGMLSLGDKSGVTVEFPFTSSMPAVVAVGMGREPAGRTAMAQMLTIAHPEYGQGLLSLLQLPAGMTGKGAGEVANDLNVAELDDSVGFPSWGAWTVRGGDDPAVTHARFMPNAYARPGLATTAMHYDYLRSQWAQEQLVPAAIVEAVRAGRR